ncbi:MAG: ribonuclease P protein component [Paracoccaceae bacterium]
MPPPGPLGRPDAALPAAPEPPRAATLRSGPPIERITARADFLAAARARKRGTAAFHLQARARGMAGGDDGDRAGGDGGPVRVGITCSRKVGNAVARNRAKRRLREVARLTLPEHGRPGWDYVLVGRAGITAAHPFADMRADLIDALAHVHR